MAAYVSPQGEGIIREKKPVLPRTDFEAIPLTHAPIV
jgi:hypothetical protein